MTIKKLIRKLSIGVKPIFWALPPAGDFINPFSVFYTALIHSKNQLRHLLKAEFPEHELFFLNSGKSALYLAFSNIKSVSGRDVVAMPAYTCPDVASSAVKAGMRLLLLDFVQAGKLEVGCPSDDQVEMLSCTVGTNLFGLYDSTKLGAFSSHHKRYHIEDACQGALSQTGQDSGGRKALGVNEDVIGLFSFGRGKAYCGAGGGLLIIPKRSEFHTLLADMSHHYRDLSKPHFVDSASYLIKLFVYWVLERPYFYWILRFVPFSGLGETKVHLNFPIRRSSRMELAGMLVSLRSRERTKRRKLKVLDIYKGSPSSDSAARSEVPIRLPVILNEKLKLAITSAYKKKMFYLGISTSYPHCIDSYEELEAHVLNRDLENAVDIAKSIVTMPIHSYVRVRDVKNIFKLIRKIKRECNV